MFSENNKISSRQIRRLFIYDLFGINTLLLPVWLSTMAGRDGVFCIFGAWILMLCYLHFLEKMTSGMTGGYASYLKKAIGTWIGDIFLLFYFFYCVSLAAYTLYTATGLIQSSLLKEESFWLIAFFLCLLGVYGIYQGMEGRARVYELLFWFLMIPLFIMLLFALFQVQPDYWNPILYTNYKGVGRGIYLVILFSGNIFLLPFLAEFVKKKAKVVPAARGAMAFIFVMNLAVFLITLGVFNVNALQNETFPVVTLMSMTDIPGGFLKSQDAFMVGIWFFTLYALMNTGMFYSGICLKGIFGRKENFFFLFFIAVIVYVLAGLLYRVSGLSKWYFDFLWYVGTPAVILIPAVAYLGNRMGDRK